MATWLSVQASERERSCSLRTQALSASRHITRSAPVIELIRQHTDDRLVHSGRSRVWRSDSEEVQQKTASSEKVEMVKLPALNSQKFIVGSGTKCLHRKLIVSMVSRRRP